MGEGPTSGPEAGAAASSGGPTKIFLSYRRDDSAGHAGRLYDSLTRRFGRENVFMDVSTIDPGRDFVDAIEEAIGSCHAFVAVIGERWLSAADAVGNRRLDDRNDWVRLEVQTALQRGVAVMPVLVERTEMPRESELPRPLAALSRRQAVVITNAGWSDDVHRLIAAIEQTRRDATKGEGAFHRPAESFRYDAYVSYVDDDRDGAWVWETLVPRLEREGLRVAVSGDAQQPGVDRIVAVEQGITEAKRTVVVLSTAYLRDHMADFENVLAQTLGVDEGSYRVLPVTLPGTEDARLPVRLRMLTAVDLGHPRRADRNLDRLLAALKEPLPPRRSTGTASRPRD